MTSTIRGTSAALLALAALAGCASARQNRQTSSVSPNPVVVHGDSAAIANAKDDKHRYAFTKADVDFMSGMIHHHAQAIVMAKMAPTHGASSAVLTLAERIINAQTDEITLMSNWLRDRNQPVPEPSPTGMKMKMGGEEHVMLMPGMLTEEQMKQLDAARGPEFDKLFLTLMIQHHTGAVSMVKDLFARTVPVRTRPCSSSRATSNVDQTTEIARMQQMLFTLMVAESNRSDRHRSSEFVFLIPPPKRNHHVIACTSSTDRRCDAPQVTCSSSRSSAGIAVRGCVLAPAEDGRGSARRRAIPRVGLKSGLWDAAADIVEPEGHVRDAAVREVRRLDELRPGVHRQLRDSGQLQRLPGLGHLEPGQADAQDRVLLPGVAERRVGLQEPAVRVRRGWRRPARLRRAGREGRREQGPPPRHSHLRHHRHRQPEVRRATCRRAAARTRTRWSRIRSDKENVYVYISGSAGVRPAEELAGLHGRADRTRTRRCSASKSSRFRSRTRRPRTIVNGARIFDGLTAPKSHGDAPDDIAAIAAAKARGDFVADVGGQQMVLPPQFTKPMLDSIVKARNGTGNPTGADSAALRAAIPGMIAKMMGGAPEPRRSDARAPTSATTSRCIRHRSRRRCVRRLRPPARHQEPDEPGSPRRGRRLELLVLALGDVQQRRHEDALLGRVGRWWRAEVPRVGPEGVGRRRDLHDRERQAEVPELLQAARAADGTRRTASRTTAR